MRSTASSEQRAATEARDQASARLADLERAAAGGKPVTKGEREKAEAALTRAQSAWAGPWAERRAGRQAVVREHEQAVTVFVGQHYAELYDELAEDAEAVATRIDNACHEFLDAYGARQVIDSRVTTLASMVRAPHLGDVARTRGEAVAAAASALLMAGGEQAPLLRDDPRQPQQDEPPAEAEAEPEPVAAT